MRKLIHITNNITFIIIFHDGAYSPQRQKRLIDILVRCTQYILLPKEVTIHMNNHVKLYSIVNGNHICSAGYALSDGRTIIIAKRNFDELGKIIAHELGHIEHLNVHPVSTHWTDQECENYALTLEWYFDADSFQHGCTISQHINFNKERKIMRINFDIQSHRNIDS